MNNPRNRQQRPPRGNDNTRGRGRGRGTRGPLQYNNNVPTIQQVVPGAAVSIVLKQDQPTGREVQGSVQDLLTRGNHPRGIKVRLQDGRVGRVQRMAGDINSQLPVAPTTMTPQQTSGRPNRILRMEEDSRLYDEEFPSAPPPRSLAAYFPDPPSENLSSSTRPEQATFVSANAKCPICGLFEGDEVAVSRHVEEHLT